MSRLALNLVLSIVWVFLAGGLSLPRLVVGFVVGFVAIVLFEQSLGGSRSARAAGGVVALAVGFAVRLLLSSLTLTRDILRPRPRFRPALVRLDADGLSQGEMVLLANMISLTPGTVTVDADPEERALYVHSLYGGEAAQVRGQLRVFVELIHRAAGR